MNTAAPIGSSSGLLQTVDQAIHPHARPAWVATATGLATSLLIHSSVIAIGILLLHEVPKLMKPQVQVVIPVGEIVDSPSPFDHGITSKMPGIEVTPPSIGDPTGENEFKATGDVAGALLTSSVDSAIGAAPNLQVGDGSLGTKDGPPGKQAGQPLGEKLPFIKSTIGGGQPAIPVATRVVFLCDATGTMTGLKFDLLKQQLAAALPKRPTTSFNIVLFGQDKTQSVDKHALLPATPQNKRKAIDFLAKASTGGSTNPVPGLEQAFALKPEVIWLLSDGEFDNLVSYDEVVRTIEKLNKNGEVRVYTILFGDRDARAEETLKKIASDNGGTFRFVTTEELLK